MADTAIKKVLTVAGSDSSGGAGLQADLKTFQEYGTFGFTAITSIVTMDPEHGWNHAVYPVNSEQVRHQLKTVLSGSPLDAMKTGMLGSIEIIEILSETIEQHHLQNIVIDPVMVCKGESEVLQPENGIAIRDLLLPRATIVTPNLFEAGQLTRMRNISTIQEMKEAARIIYELGVKHVVIKGGKSVEGDRAVDLLFDGSEFTIFEEAKLETSYNHGAGCTFAAAIAAGLAKGLTVRDAVAKAKRFTTEGIKNGFAFNPFVGPVWHGAYNKAEQRMNS